MRGQLISAAVALLLTLIPSAFAGAAFKDVTKESGVDEAVTKHYAATKKWWMSGLDFVDLTGSGHLDIFLGAHGGKGAVLLNDGKGRFTWADPASGSLPPTEIHVACDVNEDGKPDLSMTHSDGGGMWYFNESKAEGGSSAATVNFKASNADGGPARDNSMMDMNRDGKVDWLHYGDGGVAFYLGDGKGNFKKGPGKVEGYKEGFGFNCADLNGDGFIDFIICAGGYWSDKEGKSRIMLNDGKGGFADATKDCGLYEDGMRVSGCGDVNGDGFPDLICIEHGKEASIFLNDGKGKFTKLAGAVTGMEAATHPHQVNWGIAVVVDLDNDGIADVLVNGRCFLWVLHGLGGGRFEYMNKKWSVPDHGWAAVDEGLCFGDYDEDGMLDLLCCSGDDPQKRVALLHNELPKQNYLRVRPVGQPGNKCAAGAKIRLFEAGTQKLAAYEQVIIGGHQSAHTYYGSAQTERHFGLGGRGSVDVSVEFYPSGKKVEKKGVKANATIEIAE